MVDVREVIFFDGNITDSSNLPLYISAIKRKIVEISRKKRFKDFWIVPNPEVTFFYLENGIPKKMSTINGQKKEVEDWTYNMGPYLAKETGKLILCDYSWERYFPEPASERMEEVLFAKADCPQNVFCCYTTVRADEAQRWVDRIEEGIHHCVIIDTALTLPKDGKIPEKIRAIEEAMLYDWYFAGEVKKERWYRR